VTVAPEVGDLNLHVEMRLCDGVTWYKAWDGAPSVARATLATFSGGRESMPGYPG